MLSTVPYRRRAVDCRYGMCQVGSREYFHPGYGRLQGAFEEQRQGQKGRTRAGYHHGDPTRMCYRCDSLPGPDPGGTLAIDLNGGDNVSCGCSGEKICRLGVSSSFLLANVGMHHRRQVTATRSNKRMPTMLKGVVVFVAVEIKPPVLSEGISASKG